MAQDTDDLFASLGGSLMKDLWADLEVTENDLDADNMGWSLEQLERELAHMEDQPALEPSVTSLPPLSSTATGNLGAPPTSAGPPPGLSAASLVVSHAQERQSGGLYGTPQQPQQPLPPTTPLGDAWSQSLEKFTALSLEEDFLKADSARKQTTSAPKPLPPQTPEALSFLSNATDYDISEPMILGASSAAAGMKMTSASLATPSKPPGMPSPAKKKPVLQADETTGIPVVPAPIVEKDEEPAKGKLETKGQPAPSEMPRPAPPTPHNSITMTRSTPPTPQNSFSSGGPTTPRGIVPPPQGAAMGMIVPPPVVPPQGAAAGMVVPQPMMMTPQGPVPIGMVPPPGTVVGKPIHPGQQPPPQQQQQRAPMVGTPVRMPMQPGAPTVSGGPAWQTSSQPPVPHTARSPHHQAQLPPQMQQRIFCQSHPSAPPIPATALESGFMKPRDITYVLHSMLKPVLAEGVSPDDYHIQLLTRHQRVAAAAAAAAAGTPRKGGKDGDAATATTQKTMETPQEKSKKWMQEKSILGHTARTDVTRPRALIAASPVTMTAEQQDENHQKRATLWKSRLVTDKAYQAFSNLVEIWKSSPPGSVPPYSELQPHMVRLFKYLGIVKKTEAQGDGDDKDTTTTTSYEVNEETLALLLKLPKGRTLLSRVLEQALLPPNAAQSLFPAVLKNVLPTPLNTGNNSSNEMNAVDDRLFRALVRILSGLPQIDPQIITASSQVFLNHPKQAFQTTSRMECVHALLRRGSTMAATSSNPTVAQEWSQTEEKFLEIIGAM